MSTQTDTEIEKESRPPAEQRVIAHNISWETYERLLADLANQSSPRLTYDQGTLEIMTPLPDRERVKHIIELMIEVIAEEVGLDVECLGSTTFKREDLKRGFEPDSCFYFQKAALMRGKKEIDLTIDPPPELLLEVDITSGSLNKFPIYSKIGVPEIWRHDGLKLTIHKLSGEDYIELSNSLAFPFITGNDISDFLGKSENLTRPAFLKLLREWVREVRAGQ
jgi:Uma2 family endonuclease